MTENDVILKKLESIEAQIAPIVKASKALNELKEDLIPLGNQATAILISELEEVESAFQMEDLTALIKQTMRNIRNFDFLLRQLASVIEFVKDIEPLLKSAVPQLIEYLDELERRGIIRILRATLDIRAKIADEYSPEDIEKIGDGLVAMLGVLEKMSNPQTLQFLEKMASIPSHIDLENAKKIGPMGLASIGFNCEVKEGLGVMIELTKAMGKIKDKDTENVENHQS